MTNPFEAFAERQTPAPVKAKLRAKQRLEDKRAEREGLLMMKRTPLQEKQAERSELFKLYRRWRATLRKEIATAHGADFASLMRMIRGMSWANAERVVEYVASATWLHACDAETRFEILSFINSALCNSRQREGLPVMDDGLWDEPLTPFIKIRRALLGH